MIKQKLGGVETQKEKKKSLFSSDTKGFESFDPLSLIACFGANTVTMHIAKRINHLALGGVECYDGCFFVCLVKVGCGDPLKL